MKYKCISYPQFEPNHTWLRQILLFVDEIHRIVPDGEQLNDSDKLKELVDYCPRTIHRFAPGSYVDASEFQANLLGAALDQPRFQKIAQSKKMVYRIDQVGNVEVVDWEYLHVDKLGSNVVKELSSRGMYKSSPHHNRWKLVPQGVGALILSMLANRIADAKGFDALTDQPLAFALNSLIQLSPGAASLTDGVIASAIATAYVPKNIALLPVKKYAELRKRNETARGEFAKMVRELKSIARLDHPADARVFREKLDDIVIHVGEEMERFRKSKAAESVNDWAPLALTTIVPVAAGVLFGPIPAIGTAAFTFGVTAIGKLTKPKSKVAYPKVLQTLCAADDAATKAGIRAIKKLAGR